MPFQGNVLTATGRSPLRGLLNSLILSSLAAVNLNFLNPYADIRTTTNRLTHWEQPGATCFFTFRLADSLPAPLLAAWADHREAWLAENPEPWNDEQEQEYHRKFSGTIERWLDDGHGNCLLRRSDVRSVVEQVFTKFDHDRYWHHAGVIMPNHVPRSARVSICRSC